MHSFFAPRVAKPKKKVPAALKVSETVADKENTMPENIQKEVPKKDSAGKQGTVHPFFVGGHGHKAESAQKKKKLKDQAINNDDVEYVEEVVEIVDDSKTQRPKRRSARRVLDDEVDEQVISLIEEEAATWSTKTRELTAEEKLRKKELDQQKLRQEVQDSQKLSAALYDGKAVNPFFAQKKQRGRIETKEDEQQGKAMGLLLTETLWPEYFNSHVGYTFQRPTRPLQISGFNLRSDDETRRLAEIMKVEFRTKTLMSQLGMATSCETPITIYKSLSKQDLESFLYSHYSPRVLAAPSCTKLVAQLLATDSNISLQKNTKDLWTTQYAPKSMVDLLGEQNRVIARKVRDRLNGFRPLSAETKARLTQKRSKKRGRNDTDSEDFITSDDSYSMDEDSESETGEANKIITSKHTLLIGPTGSGKSALLQAVANDCKLTIIEIHTGMKRSAKDVVAMLGETTSTRVVGGKKRALMGNDGWFGVMKRLEAQDAVVEVIDSDAVEEKNSRKKKVKASAVDFFAKRVPVPKKRSVPVTQKTPTPQIPKALVSTSSNPEVKTSKKKILIHLDDVDILTGHDKTFWTGVASLFETSRRPIILSCTENPFKAGESEAIPPSIEALLTDSMDILNIDRPNLDELSCYIQLVLLSQGIFTEPKEVRLVCSVFQGDTRAILSHLQAQTQSLAPPIDLLSDETVSFRCAENLLGTIFVPQATIGDSVPAENDLDFTSRYLEMQSITDYTIPNAYIESLVPDTYDGTSVVEPLVAASPLMHSQLKNSTSLASVKLQLELQSYTLSKSTELMRTQGSPCISNAASSFVGPSSDMDALTKSQDDWLSEWKELTGNLFYWEFVNERVFTASLLPWLTLICRADQKRFAKSGSALNQGRTRRAKKACRIYEAEMSLEVYQMISQPWFTTQSAIENDDSSDSM